MPPPLRPKLLRRSKVDLNQSLSFLQVSKCRQDQHWSMTSRSPSTPGADHISSETPTNPSGVASKGFPEKCLAVKNALIKTNEPFFGDLRMASEHGALQNCPTAGHSGFPTELLVRVGRMGWSVGVEVFYCVLGFCVQLVRVLFQRFLVFSRVL